jgi:methyl-accepting chemotaxis protein
MQSKSSPPDNPHKHARTLDADAMALGTTVRSVQRRIVAGGGAVALIIVVVFAWSGMVWVESVLGASNVELLREERQTILLGAAIMVGLVELALLFLSRYVARRVTEPAAALAAAAERVTSGDLAVDVVQIEEDDEMGRLSRATAQMIAELRRLVHILRESARDTASMSAEITTGTEQLSGTASEMAHTSSELSQHAGEMAQSIASTAADAARLMLISERLSEGARNGVERNELLAELARNNRERLDESSASLTALAAEASASAASAEMLAAASEEIHTFVTFVRKIARQSKLLALNAAMEAARAGDRGDGFTVVATEIGKLASISTESTERTAAIVREILARVDESREYSQRTAVTVQSVQRATQDAMDFFAQIEAAVQDAHGWSTAVDQAATESRHLISESTTRLDNLSRGTESFAAAMQQVAAATEQQSASAEEIAAASAALASASQRLLEIVSVFRLDAPGEESVAAAERRAQRAKTREPSAAASTGLVRLAASPDRA